MGTTVAAGQLVVSVTDSEPHLPNLTLEGMSPGLRTVYEPAADHDGDLSAEPALDHDGKVVLARFEIPLQARTTTSTALALANFLPAIAKAYAFHRHSASPLTQPAPLVWT